MNGSAGDGQPETIHIDRVYKSVTASATLADATKISAGL